MGAKSASIYSCLAIDHPPGQSPTPVAHGLEDFLDLSGNRDGIRTRLGSAIEAAQNWRAAISRSMRRRTLSCEGWGARDSAPAGCASSIAALTCSNKCRRRRIPPSQWREIGNRKSEGRASGMEIARGWCRWYRRGYRPANAPSRPHGCSRSTPEMPQGLLLRGASVGCPRVVKFHVCFSADLGAAKARRARRLAHEVVPAGVYSIGGRPAALAPTKKPARPLI